MDIDDDARDWPLAVRGDHDAFERVFDRHADLIFRFARRRTGDVDLAEEIVSQVFLEAWRQRSRVELLGGSLRSWLLGVAANLVKRHWRRLDRRNRAIGRFALPVPVLDHADEVAERLDGQRRLIGLRAKLEKMPRKHVEVLLLWAWEELSYEEIAKVLNIPVGTVRSRLSRTRKRLSDGEGTGIGDRAFPRRKPDGDDSPVPNPERSTG
ncbi:ECF RNA polymerase sigma factor SigW [bacterium BMS3Bbin02]|nr:ECF RNA polymerase sigma factor SigW [bacterium BMS3Bbin02]